MNRGEQVPVRIGKTGRIVCSFDSEAACRGEDCGERILWVVTPKGARMPVDPDPGEDGLYENHWGTCPNAKDF